MTYPYEWTTKSGHKVVVTNEFRGQYEFEILENTGRTSQMVFSQVGSETPIHERNGDLTPVQHEVYIEWSQLSQML